MPGKAARTSFLVRRLQLDMYNRMVDTLLSFRLTPTQYMVLSLAADHGMLCTADMARRFQIAPQSMNQTVATLLRKRLLARRESPDHRRILHIRLTPAGTRLLEKCDAAIDAMERDAFGHFQPEELAALRTLLLKALSKPPSLAPRHAGERRAATLHR
jgi:DNA-binding MarR family transcriptional regulator